MQQTLIVGVDVSQSTLDIYFQPLHQHLQITNDLAGFQEWYRFLQRAGKFVQVLVVMEHTGSYSYRFEKFLRSKSIDFCKIAALEIKRSIGVVRGKNDKVDAARIAEYGWLRRDTLKAEAAVHPIIQQLELWIGLRQKMVRDRSGYLARTRLYKTTGADESNRELRKMEQQIIATLTQQIKEADAKILTLLKSDKAIYTNYLLVTSIKGVGLQVAAYMICTTRNFSRFKDFRKFNCYAGLAPFPHESGSSIKSRSRISHLANKKAKTLLNLAAFSSLRYDAEMKQYYTKRVAEGKSRMSCVNIIRSKIVSRMFAVVKRQTPYQPISIAA